MGLIGPGSRVAGRYVVLEELGRGGMGVVYLARDERGHREVAIKVLREAFEAEASRRLRREARAMGALDPGGVAQVFEVGETPGGELYLVMEYVRGVTLRFLLRRGRLAHAESLRILRQVATTLGQAHRAGLVHRDVKPDNIMVCEDGRAVLLDFGIVKRLAAGLDTANLSTQLTADGSVIGTPAYLSPEQALGRAVGPETDQFALAVTAFEMLTGKLPWTATEVTTILAQVLVETPPAATTIDGKLQPGFDAVLARALSKGTTRRFATIDEFADALEAAERGEYVALEVSETVAAPLAVPTGLGLPRGQGVALPARRKWVAGLALLAAGASWAGFAARGRGAPAARATSPLDAALAELSGPAARLACPIFEVRGAPEVAVRLGAATATLACLRARWYLGGRDDHVLPPAALLDAPRGPSAAYADPYVDAGRRKQTVDLARTRAGAYLDGVVTREGDDWIMDLVVRAPDAGELTRAQGRDAAYLVALKKAGDALWKAPLVRRAIDPDVHRWTSFPDAETGLLDTDARLLYSQDGCGALRGREAELGNAFFRLEHDCELNGFPGSEDAGAPVLDESSPEALALSVSALLDWDVPVPLEEMRRLATKLDELRGRETSGVGRAQLGFAAGRLWTAAKDTEPARAAVLFGVREDPLVLDLWALLTTTAGSAASAPASDVASAWFPAESIFLTKANSYRGDDLDARLREARLAYIVEPRLERALLLGRALAEAGRADEARTVADTPLDSPESSRSLRSDLLALTDLHDAKLGRAIPRLEDAGNIGMNDLLVVASVAGLTGDVATRWASRFLSSPDEQVDGTVRGYNGPVVLCMSARRDSASRCLDRVFEDRARDHELVGRGGEELLEGAQRYARGDLRGAVSLWRPLVAGPTNGIVRILPTEAFERAGEPELAARLDARKMAYTFIAGVSDAAPREAKRALSAGDRARARALAKKVIEAWEVADVDVPAVAEMRAILRAAGP